MTEEVNITIQAIASAVDSLPAGWIRIFLGEIADIPAGWLLCDGANGTPDLRGSFIRGALAGQGSGNVGGSETHQHSFDVLSECAGCHGHNVGGDTTYDGSYHSHSFYGETDYNEHYHYIYGWAEPCYYDYIEVDYGCGGERVSCCWHSHDIYGEAYDGFHSHLVYGCTDEAADYHSHEIAGYTTYDGCHSHRVCGQVAAGDNLPPHYDVLFLMKA